MHYHAIPDDPSPPPVYCAAHLPSDVMATECDNPDHTCDVCEETA